MFKDILRCPKCFHKPIVEYRVPPTRVYCYCELLKSQRSTKLYKLRDPQDEWLKCEKCKKVSLFPYWWQQDNLDIICDFT